MGRKDHETNKNLRVEVPCIGRILALNLTTYPPCTVATVRRVIKIGSRVCGIFGSPYMECWCLEQHFRWCFRSQRTVWLVFYSILYMHCGMKRVVIRVKYNQTHRDRPPEGRRTAVENFGHCLSLLRTFLVICSALYGDQNSTLIPYPKLYT